MKEGLSWYQPISPPHPPSLRRRVVAYIGGIFEWEEEDVEVEVEAEEEVEV